MDTYERAVLKWIRDQRAAVTITEIHSHFQTMNFVMLQGVLNSLASLKKVERGVPRGFKETWQARSDV